MLPPLHGARRPSYVVIWHIAPYWLPSGYSVRPLARLDSIDQVSQARLFVFLPGREPIR